MGQWERKAPRLTFTPPNDPHHHLRRRLRSDRLHFAIKRWRRANRAPNGDYFIWLDPRYVDRLRALRGPGESYSDVILRLAGGELVAGQANHA